MTDGKRSLFESPPHRSTGTEIGKESLFSDHDHRSTTVACSRCHETTRVDCLDALARIAWFSVWIPGKRNNRWIICPACHQRAWARIRWLDS